MALVTSKEMFQNAYQERYAIGAFNVNNMEFIQAATQAAQELNSPVILAISAAAIRYAGLDYLADLGKLAARKAQTPVCLHLDHGNSYELCRDCVDAGFTSVMIDGSALPYEENIALTRQVAEYAHSKNVVVEAELGKLAGIEEDVQVHASLSMFTDPAQAYDFIKRTEIDSLAIAIGTSHGTSKFKPGTSPKLRFDIIAEIQTLLPNFPLVLHGASCIMPEYVEMNRNFGGILADAAGIPMDMLQDAAKTAVCKMNFGSDLRLCATASIRKFLHENPDIIDNSAYLSVARNAITEIVKTKIQHILGSADRAYSNA